jgi:hypothetical protein
MVNVGACDGALFDDVTPWLHRIAGARAVLVEPIPYNQKRLRANYPDTSRFIIEPVAVTKTKGTITVHTFDAAALDQVVGDGRADDTTQTDDDDLRLFRKLCHCPRLQRDRRARLRALRMAHNMQRTRIGLPPVCDTPQVRRDPASGLGSEWNSSQAKAQMSSAWKPT